MMNMLRKITAVFFILGTILPQGTVLAADEPETTKKKNISEQMTLPLGDLQTVMVKNLARVAVTDPLVVDIADAQADRVLIVAKKTGQTMVFLWDDDGKHSISVRVTGQDLTMMKKRFAHLLKEARIDGLDLEASETEGKVLISGIMNKATKLRFEKVMGPYYDQVINVTKEKENEELIQIDMQITELASTLDKALGFNWNSTLEYGETLPSLNGAKDWLKLGDINRTTAIVNTINMFISEGKARELSRPRILVSSGKEATMNVGGEVPISTTTNTASAGGLTQTSISFKQYGVTVTVTPTIKEGKIEIVLNLQVSDIDNTFALPATSTSDIAYKTRSAQTQLMLDDRQTVVFAGLIRYTDSETNKRVPFLGKVPVLGLLFRSHSKPSPDQGRELVVTLTPTIVRNKEYVKDQLKLPTKEHVAFANEVDRVRGYERETPDGQPLEQTSADMASPAAGNAPAGSSGSGGSGSGGSKSPGVAGLISGENGSGSGAVGAGTRVNSSVSPYVRSVQMKISQAINYPQEALRNGWDGTVKLRLHILNDGSLANAEVMNSSGHDVFDRDALNTAKSVAPYPAFTTDMNNKDITITLPITYSQVTSSRPDTQAVVAAY